MADVTMPAPIAAAGAAFCLLGGYLIGAVAGPETTSRSTAEVASYEQDTEKLCLRGEAVAEAPGADDGVLCGVWRHDEEVRRPAPQEGDTFRFVTLRNEGADADEATILIYGDVVR